ncbi:hypothetical protein J4E91_006545 [Alternaria rosae]|nr:hypothetical protein J4E91_006545 [Alternaria rosae]
MPAPPAYHTVVEPTLPIPNMTNPYDPQEEDCDPSQETTDDTPEITINAATQIRGHGNIISMVQMDSVRIANLIATVLSGETIETSKMGEDDAAARPPTPESPTTQKTATAQREYGAEESGGAAGSATATTGFCGGGGGGGGGRTTTKDAIAERIPVPNEACDTSDES